VDAFVEHVEIDGGWYWNVGWFDPNAETSYRMELETGGAFEPFDKAALTASNLAGAKIAAAVADKLVIWTGS
jgi:hypothetical protein